LQLTDAVSERARETVETYCVIERFLFSVLDIATYCEEARLLKGVIDETAAVRLDTIIGHRPACPDRFDVETDKSASLRAEADD
jgi:Mn-dependent DtxR family transcriptional regulator